MKGTSSTGKCWLLTRCRIRVVDATILRYALSLKSRSEGGEPYRTKEGSEEALWLAGVRSWAAAKTSGVGYSLNYSGSRLGGALLLNFTPFFLPTISFNRANSKEEGSTSVGPETVIEPEVEHLAKQAEISEESAMQDVPATRVRVGVEFGETNDRQSEGVVLQPCAA